ncbi:ABC-three component system middle component 1 [Paenibacillus sp. FSL L8-0436]|uniref:ABC-three component system middle component 1 n=1 Tax=Paenibacillus sp. FSL L8-0436 TaxID=2954686 RepID=UPI00315856D0
MIRIFNALFEENKFNVQHFISMPTNTFALDISRGSYYLVIFLDETSIDHSSVDLFNSYFDEIKGLEVGYRPDMDKNTSLIVCIKRKELHPSPVLNKIIFDIEEDPYFFKKYVLTYTESQVEIVIKNWGDSSIMEYMHTILNDEGLFQSHKTSQFLNTEYNLVSQFFIKLPFLSLRKMDRELSSLKKEIENLLTPSILTLRDELLNLRSDDKLDEETRRNLILEFIKVEKYE